MERIFTTEIKAHIGARVQLLGLDNIRLAALFPRDLNRLTP